MFEEKSNFDFDDDMLEASFSKNHNSSGEKHQDKRIREGLEKENAKRTKLVITDNTYENRAVETTPKNTTFANSPNKFMRRRFPGPAGLLPDTFENDISVLKMINSETISKQNEDIALCSQYTYSLFEDGPWKEMTKDFQASSEEQLYEKFNISWIKSNSCMRKLLVNHKAPFLAAVIDSLEINDGKIPSINVTLKDRTGIIQGTVLHSLYEEYSDFFTLGSVLVLKQFGVLSIQNTHCLTITLNNLLAIYHSQAKLPSNSQNENGSVKRIIVQQCSVPEIWKKYHEDLNSYQKVKCLNFGKLFQNRCKSIDSSSEFIDPNLRNTCKSPKIKEICTNSSNKNFNITSNSTRSIILKTESQNVSISKFNFRQSDGCQNLKDINQKPCDINQKLKNESNNVTISCSQISVTSDQKHSEIWKNLFEELDTDSLFDDF